MISIKSRLFYLAVALLSLSAGLISAAIDTNNGPNSNDDDVASNSNDHQTIEETKGGEHRPQQTQQPLRTSEISLLNL